MKLTEDPLARVYRLEHYRGRARSAPAEDGAVWDEVEAAARLFGDLRAAGMSVRFEPAGAARPPRVWITDLQGRVLRDVAPATACDPAALEAELLG